MILNNYLFSHLFNNFFTSKFCPKNFATENLPKKTLSFHNGNMPTSLKTLQPNWRTEVEEVTAEDWKYGNIYVLSVRLVCMVYTGLLVGLKI